MLNRINACLVGWMTQRSKEETAVTEEMKQVQNRALSLAGMTFLAAVYTVLPDIGFASGTGGGGTFSGGICKAVALVTSDAGKAIATAAIITIAIGALLGRVSWGMAVMIAAGIAGIFAAPQIANKIAEGAGGTRGSACENATF
jgi:type IV secretory pathway VirB2 component (pilin)